MFEGNIIVGMENHSGELTHYVLFNPYFASDGIRPSHYRYIRKNGSYWFDDHTGGLFPYRTIKDIIPILEGVN